MKGHVVFDERQDVLASLEHCVMSLSQARDSESELKWVILSLHSAFQGAMVCHLSGPEQCNLFYKKRNAEEWSKWQEKNKHKETKLIKNGVYKPGNPKMRIAPATVLFKRLGDEKERLEEITVGKVISINAQQMKSFETINNLRNEFTHFSPRVWVMSIDFIKSLIMDPMKDVLDVFEKIIEDPRTFEPRDKIILRSKIAKIRSLLEEI